MRKRAESGGWCRACGLLYSFWALYPIASSISPDPRPPLRIAGTLPPPPPLQGKQHLGAALANLQFILHGPGPVSWAGAVISLIRCLPHMSVLGLCSEGG